MAYRAACLAIAVFLAACSAAEDPLADLAVGERGRVVRVFDGDALSLDTGQSVRLIGIEAPAAPYRNREGEPGYEASKRLLEDIYSGAKWSCAMPASPATGMTAPLRMSSRPMRSAPASG